MAEIVDASGRTDDVLDILTNVCAYGHYSRPTLFAAYEKTLIDKCALGKTVRRVVYAPELYRCLRLQQFPEALFDSERKFPEKIRRRFQANRLSARKLFAEEPTRIGRGHFISRWPEPAPLYCPFQPSPFEIPKSPELRRVPLSRAITFTRRTRGSEDAGCSHA